MAAILLFVYNRKKSKSNQVIICLDWFEEPQMYIDMFYNSSTLN